MEQLCTAKRHRVDLSTALEISPKRFAQAVFNAISLGGLRRQRLSGVGVKPPPANHGKSQAVLRWVPPANMAGGISASASSLHLPTV